MKVCSPLFAVAIAAAVFAPHARGTTECSKLCTDDSTTCTPKSITTPETIEAPSVTCGYGKQYLSALKISSVGGVGITVAFKQGTTDVTASSTDSAAVTGATDKCYLTYADVGKTATLTNDVKFAVSCVGSATCDVNYAATWACQPCGTNLVGDTSSLAKTLAKDGTWALTNPDSCPDGHFSYLKSLKLGSQAQSAFSVDYDGATKPTADSGTKVGTCYYEYGQAPATADLPSQAKDVTATVTCTDAAGCVVQAKPVWGCDAPTCAAVVTGGTDQVLVAGTGAGSSFDIKKPNTKVCDAGQIAYPKNLVVGGKYAAHNVVVTFNNGLTPNPTFAWDNCYFAYGANPVGTSPVTEDVKATVTCKDPSKPCTFQYKVDSWECFAPKCQLLCTADTCATKSITAAAGKVTLPAPAPPSACPTGKTQYITSLKVSAADGKGVVVAFKDGDKALTVKEADKKTNGVKTTDYCGWTYTNVGRDETLTNDVTAEITCQTATTCDFKVDATWKCQRDGSLCPLEADGTDQTIAANGNFELTNTDDCPTFNYLKSLKVGSKAKHDIAVTYTGVAKPDAVTTDPSTGACYFEYGAPSGTPTDNVKATVTCAPATDTCIIQAKPEWACGAPTCDKTCGTGCIAQNLVSGTGTGSSLVLNKGSTSCPDKQFAYPKNLVIGSKFKTYINVAFSGGLSPTPTDSSSDCYYAYGADPIGTSAITADTTVTVTCQNTAKACSFQYKVDSWECKPPSCKTLCTADTCKDGAVPAGDKFTIPPPTKACPGGKFHYLSALAVSAANGDGVAVTFKNNGADLSTSVTADASNDNGVKTDKCSLTYSNIGKTETLAADLTAQVTCTGTAACAIKYDATWTCQRGDTWCPRECVGDGCVDNNVAQGTPLSLNPDACVAGSYNYLKSFTVGSRMAKAFTTKFSGVAASGDLDHQGTCYYVYGQVPADLSSLSTDLPVTVECTTGTCDIQTNPEWKCTMPTCGKTIATGGIDQTIAKGGSFVLAKDKSKTCDVGQFAYPKGLAVVSKGVTVTFNNGLTPTAGNTAGTCYAEYADPVGTSVVTSDVTVTFTCTDATKKCPLQYKVDSWGCYAPPSKTYTRSSLTGDHCETDLSKCANRCAKSYKMATKDGLAVFVPQTGTDCATPCAPVTTMSTDATHAANPKTLMNVVFETKTDPMYVDFTDSATACKSTYAIANFSSSFIEETYTRQTVAPNSTDCYKPTDCGYRCAAEFALTAPPGDTIQVARPQVPTTAEAPCSCTNTTAYVSDDGSKATGAGDAVTYAFEALNSTHLALDTTAGGKTCRSIYGIKPKPTEPPAPTDPATDAPKPSTAPTNAPSPTTPATTTKTGTSAGVSAMGGGAGAGVTTVTLIAAAAGVQAVGLPAN